MVVDDLDLVSIFISPNEAQPELFVNPDGILAGPVPSQKFKGVAGIAEVVQAPRRVQLEQLANRRLSDRLKPPHAGPVKDLFRVKAPKRANHIYIVYR